MAGLGSLSLLPEAVEERLCVVGLGSHRTVVGRARRQGIETSFEVRREREAVESSGQWGVVDGLVVAASESNGVGRRTCVCEYRDELMHL
jgi:hypothetical protein